MTAAIFPKPGAEGSAVWLGPVEATALQLSNDQLHEIFQ